MNLLSRIGLSVILFLSLLVPWGMKSTNEDLFIALAAGRDVLNGQLGKPDTWSFATSGQIWVNQAWLSGLFFYESYYALNEWGPFLIKGALICGIALILFLRSLWIGAGLGAAILALSMGLLCSAPFTGIRPDNFGVFYAVLLSAFMVAPARFGLLRFFGALITIILWANSHGSFMFGFVLLALKVFISGCESLFPDQVAHEKVLPTRETWGWLAVLILAVLASVLLSPFGIQNLAMPFRQVGSGEWVASNIDWYPLLSISVLEKGLFAPRDVKPFLGMLSIAVLLAAILARQVAPFLPNDCRQAPLGIPSRSSFSGHGFQVQKAGLVCRSPVHAFDGFLIPNVS